MRSYIAGFALTAAFGIDLAATCASAWAHNFGLTAVGALALSFITVGLMLDARTWK
jgi:hypothetical protein